MTAEFDRPGTRDPSPYLAAPFAIQLMNEFGGADGVSSIYRYNHELACWAAELRCAFNYFRFRPRSA